MTLTKVKTFTDHEFTVPKMMTLVFDRTENIVRKEENAG